METNLFSNGARLVWRHQRLVWWIFFVGLILAFLASLPLRAALAPVLNHSLASRALVEGFDIGTFMEAMHDPSISSGALHSAGIVMSLVFFVYMIFINGGVLTVYGEDRKLPRAEFFEMSGAYFWRMVRLTLFSLIPFGIAFGIFNAINDASDRLSSDAANGLTGFYVLVAGLVFLWLAALFIRMWFDLAQSTTVAQNERGMLRMTWRAFLRSFRALSSLYAAYISIHIIGILAMLALCFAWLHIPHSAVGVSFLLLEVLMLIEISVRLWQKAACMTYVESHSMVLATPSYELSPASNSVLAPPVEPGPASPPPEV